MVSVVEDDESVDAGVVSVVPDDESVDPSVESPTEVVVSGVDAVESDESAAGVEESDVDEGGVDVEVPEESVVVVVELASGFESVVVVESVLGVADPDSSVDDELFVVESAG